jgi:CTP:molybdopterin cytidylyltransferase MocA
MQYFHDASETVSRTKRIGVILAAGRGGRMGGKKQLTPWPAVDGNKPLVAASYDVIHSICDEMVVVLGHIAGSVVGALGERPFHRAESDPDAPMFESIRAGIRAALLIDPSAAIVLQPCDHPEVAPSTLQKIIDEAVVRPHQAIIPQFADRGGHPALIPSSICHQLVATDCPHGLGQFWLDHPELCHRVPINDPAVVRDIDTPADLG